MLSFDRLDLGPLRERSFRFLFLGRTTSFVGSSFANIALAFAVLDLTGSKSDLGFVLAARTLPQVLFRVATRRCPPIAERALHATSARAPFVRRYGSTLSCT